MNWKRFLAACAPALLVGGCSISLVSDEDLARSMAFDACETLLFDRQPDQTPEQWRAGIAAAADDAEAAANRDAAWAYLATLATDKAEQLDTFATIFEAAQEVAAENGSDPYAKTMDAADPLLEEMMETDQLIAHECEKATS